MSKYYKEMPWVLSVGSNGSVLICAGNMLIATLARGTFKTETAVANANLIGVAPDMYKILERVLHNMKLQNNPRNEDSIYAIECVLKMADGE